MGINPVTHEPIRDRQDHPQPEIRASKSDRPQTNPMSPSSPSTSLPSTTTIPTSGNTFDDLAMLFPDDDEMMTMMTGFWGGEESFRWE
ncbi:hypothetical protein MLD38_034654 [Melastoma candidum]|uniref:Uncharacterized protein n=1 Tax=Melastoma candidum TaxID=119954 RepID=A0ACB9MA93_9MYRT|nr:hypothetical protein MLD38_034654 [Melastoma candidum]